MPSTFSLYLDNNIFYLTVFLNCFRRLLLIYIPEWQKTREVRKRWPQECNRIRSHVVKARCLHTTEHIPTWRHYIIDGWVLYRIFVCCLSICKHLLVNCSDFLHWFWKNRTKALITIVFRCCAILTREHFIHSKSRLACVYWMQEEAWEQLVFH